MARGRLSGGEQAGAPGEQQAEHIAQVMTGIGQQSQRRGQQPEDGLDNHKKYIQNHSDRERPGVIRWIVVVMVVIVGAH
jgi:hypothetical protein